MRRALMAMVVLAALLAPWPGLAQPATPSPEQLRALALLLRDPELQAWLQAQAQAEPAPGMAQPALREPASARQAMAGQLSRMRVFVRALAAAIPQLPAELGRAWQKLAGDMQERGALGVTVLLAAFAALGFGLEWLFWWATSGFRQRMIATRLDSVRDRLQAVGRRFAYGIGVVLAFALGSIGGFLLFEWPPVLKEVVLGYLLVFLVIRLVLVLGRILLAPGAERFRMVPMATASAWFWFVWSAILIGWFAFVNITLDVLALLGASAPARYLVGLACGIVLVALALFVVWRHPQRQSGLPAQRGHQIGAWLLSLYIVVVWLLLFTGSAAPFYVGVILLILPIAIRGVHLWLKRGKETAEAGTAERAPVQLIIGILSRKGLGGCRARRQPSVNLSRLMVCSVGPCDRRNPCPRQIKGAGGWQPGVARCS